MKKIATNNGGILLSRKWQGRLSKYKFMTFEQEIFERSYEYVVHIGWIKTTPGCYFLNKMDKIANENGGKLLSTEWKGSRVKYKFMTSEQEVFERSYEVLINRGWKAIKIYHFLNKMDEIAKENGGKLLSTEWKGTLSKYKFITSEQEIFERSYKVLIQNGWRK
ncbi:hypothetical protein [Methylovorus glucosotrophus]|uniref:Uncharacterized protein n=1 Tax=Methylovorus glucosotrophus (strain SIP3-4) TaxID=582744 RepID=C6X7Z2_METGS|nr:hypothetical protein [Methylovorus glucosotrophus]ACT51319.1 hypothetical protein Msip34_2077 [Methylovorus glucosotrophus SIP3-4]